MTSTPGDLALAAAFDRLGDGDYIGGLSGETMTEITHLGDFTMIANHTQLLRGFHRLNTTRGL